MANRLEDIEKLVLEDAALGAHDDEDDEEATIL